jgi:hypothetical protein
MLTTRSSIPRAATRGRRPALSHTTWSYRYKVEGKRFFLKDLAEFVTRLQGKAEFLRELTDTGGRVVVDVSLPGHVNMGDVIGWQDLEKMAALRLNFGIEVFPNFRPSSAC